MNIKYLENKNILILGLGVTGFQTVEAISEYKNNIFIVNDTKNENLEKLEVNGFKVFLTKEFIKKKIDVDIIIKSPGIKEHEILSIYKNSEIINDIELAYIYIQENKMNTKIVAVTGTNGKTSTTEFLKHILKSKYKNTYFSGNIGISPLKVLNEKTVEFLILEISSYQLMNLKRFKADYAFLLNITPDHLDYHNTFEEYENIKYKIFMNQTSKDFAFINKDLKIQEIIKSEIYKSQEEMKYDHISINKNNLNLIFQFSEILGITKKKFENRLNTFKVLEHRVEFVREKNGIKYYNDSKATNLIATKQALKKINNITLIIGGYDNNEDLTKFSSYLGNVKRIIAYGQNKFKFKDKKVCDYVNTLEEAVLIAKKKSQVGDSVLLSPASKSYDQYNNYIERGLEFKEIVMSFKNIIIAGGGSGGHLYPGLEMANFFQKKGHEILYIASNKEVDKKIIKLQKINNIEYIYLNAMGLDRRKNLEAFQNNLSSFIKYIKINQKIKKILKTDIDLVIGVGGYVSYNALNIAAKLNIKTFIHEQNSYPGLVNRKLAPKVDIIGYAYETSKKYFKNNEYKMVNVANPRVDVALKKINKNFSNELGLSSKPKILFLGGSLGAKTINDLFEQMDGKFTNYQKILIGGLTNNKKFEFKDPDSLVVEHTEALLEYMATSDIIISRAGATTLLEIIYLEKKSIIIPSPNVTENHQYLNAKEFSDKNLIKLVEETNDLNHIIENEIKLLEKNTKILEELKKFKKIKSLEKINNIIGDK